MAYNIDNWGYINSNATITVYFTFDGNSKGSQWAEGIPQDAGSTLITTNSGVSFGTDSKFSYQFDLTNRGRATRFGLHGGGQT